MTDAHRGAHEDQMFTVSRNMVAGPDTSIRDYVLAEQGIERLRDAFAAHFRRFDALLLPVLPIPAHEFGSPTSPSTATPWMPHTSRPPASPSA